MINNFKPECSKNEKLNEKLKPAYNNGYSSMPARLAHGKFAASQRTGEFAGTSSIAFRWLQSQVQINL